MDTKALHGIFLNSLGVATDTRKVENGQLFFALKGESFNGNQFADQALAKGASYAIVDEAEYIKNEKYILVEDVLESLQKLANYHRKQLKIPIIAITGTNGKTTSKELVSAVLQAKFKIGYTKGNLNNHIGVPLTLLSFNKSTEIGIVEMGANHIGEIGNLCKIVQPDYGVITNIGKAHLEGFGSFEGVIKAKSELYLYLKDNNKPVFINGNDNVLLDNSLDLEKIKYGSDKSFFCYGEFIEASPFLSIKWNENIIQSQLVGEYNFNNILLAICIGSYFKVKDDVIVNALSAYKPDNNRSQLSHTEKNTLIIDAYNANPSSMELSILNFKNIKDESKLLILGDMFELGVNSRKEHQNIIDLLIQNNFKDVFLVGSNFYELKNDKFEWIKHFENTQKLIQYIGENEIKGKTILLKASRGVQLEKVIPFL